MRKLKFITYSDLDFEGYQKKVNFCNKERMYFGKELTVCEFLACLEDINYHTEVEALLKLPVEIIENIKNCYSFNNYCGFLNYSGRDYFEQFNNIYFDKAKEYDFDIDETINFKK